MKPTLTPQQDKSADTLKQGLNATEDSFGKRTLKRFRRHRMAVASIVVLTIILLSVILVPLTSPEAFRKIDPRQRFQAPSTSHPFGTDELGRQTFMRVMLGGRFSLLVGVAGALSTTLLGGVVGAVSGYYGGRVDNVLMRITDVMLTLPTLPLMLLVSTLFKGGIGTVIAIVAAFFWMSTARMIRSRFLSLKTEAFVEAARAAGCSSPRIIFRHMLPNSIDILTVSATLTVSTAIMYEATLSFLGFGVQPPTPTWGNLLQRSLQYMLGMPGSTTVPWWLIFFPGFFILLTVLCVNFLGDGLRDALDPRSRT